MRVEFCSCRLVLDALVVSFIVLSCRLLLWIHPENSWEASGAVGNLPSWTSKNASLLRGCWTLKNASSLRGPSLVTRPTQLIDDHVVYLAIGSAGYTYSMSLLAESLALFGIPDRNIIFGCVDGECNQFCFASMYQCLSMPSNAEMFCGQWPHSQQLRCKVSSMKLYTVSKILQAGRSVFFLDLDVFLYRHPLAGVPASPPHVDIMIQPNDAGHKRWNFGLFLAYPTDSSIKFFHNMQSAFQLTKKWDQAIFNKMLHAPGIKSAALDLKFYPALMINAAVGHKIVAAHATCVEGALTKILAVESKFGVIPARRLKLLKTVSTSLPFDGLQLQASELDKLIMPLIAIALKTGRAIRIRTATPQRVFSYDRLSKIGVHVVPASFWNNRSYTSTIVRSMSSAVSATSDEVLSEPGLNAETSKPIKNSFTCRHLRYNAKCLHHCDGKHF